MIFKLLKFILTVFYRIEIQGLANYHQAGDKVLIVANHLSYLDAILLAVFLPEKPIFIINTYVAEKLWVKPWLRFVEFYTVDPAHPISAKLIVKRLRAGAKCVVFPEAKLTMTGSLAKIYEGPGMLASQSGAKILPVRIDGVQYSIFSALPNKVRAKLLPKVTMTILPPCSLATDLVGRERRQASARELYDLMSAMMFDSSEYQKTLFTSLLDARHIYGAKHDVVVDIEKQPSNYDELITRSLIVGQRISQETEQGDSVGVLLPNMIATIVVFYGMQAYARIPAMLNYTAGIASVLSSSQAAALRVVYTSRKFVDLLELGELIGEFSKIGIKVIYLEDLRNQITIVDKLSAWVKSKLLNCMNFLPTVSPHDTAVVLFTSGSEGKPKGVALSHSNLQANRFQLGSRFNYGITDVVFNTLPIFHAFGLTAGSILPLLAGIKTFYYPSPLHYKIVPELIYESKATMLYGTDTFLRGYARGCRPYDFYTLRYVFAGAEKLKEDTRKLWMDRFGIRILEGYGATETAPVLSINSMMQNKFGTVGRLLPGIQYRLEEVDGITEGKKLWVKGPNIMKGYLLCEEPGVLHALKDGWYDTGDIVSVDDEDYITIVGRAKRFAKVAGEMISLTAVEELVTSIWPGFQHAIVSVDDSSRGEQIVLFTTNPQASREDIISYIKKTGLSELMNPRQIKHVDSIALLASGKVDYLTLEKLVFD